MKKLLVLASLLFFYQPSLAQEQQDYLKNFKKNRPGSIYGLNLGPYLPNKINGVSEVLSSWAFNYSTRSRGGYLNFGGQLANSHGVNYRNINLGIRGDYPVEDLIVFAQLGGDLHHFTDSIVNTDGKLFAGGHFRGGFLAHVADNLWMSLEMKFNVNPGTALYFGFGLETRVPFSKDDDKDDDD